MHLKHKISRDLKSDIVYSSALLELPSPNDKDIYDRFSLRFGFIVRVTYFSLRVVLLDGIKTD